MTAPLPAARLIGQTLEFAEDDYRFGTGPLTLRVTAVLHLQQLPDGLWLYVRGAQIRWDGSESARPRQVLVRVATLPAGALLTDATTD